MSLPSVSAAGALPTTRAFSSRRARREGTLVSPYAVSTERPLLQPRRGHLRQRRPRIRGAPLRGFVPPLSLDRRPGLCANAAPGSGGRPSVAPPPAVSGSASRASAPTPPRIRGAPLRGSAAPPPAVSGSASRAFASTLSLDRARRGPSRRRPLGIGAPRSALRWGGAGAAPQKTPRSSCCAARPQHLHRPVSLTRDGA